MNRRALIFALPVLLGLALYAWLALRQDERERSGRWEEGARVFSVARERISSFELSGPEGRQVAFRRGEAGWEAVEGDREFRPERIPELFYSWSMVRFSRYVDENPDDLSPFGLDPPRYHLAAESKDGKRYSLAIGSDSFLTSALGTYACVDAVPAVLVLDASAWSLLEELDIAFGLREAPDESDSELPH